jgi:hypothetical protein
VREADDAYAEHDEQKLLRGFERLGDGGAGWE